MINKIAAILGTGLTIIFLLSVTITLNASNMITFFDIHVADAMAKKFLKKNNFLN